MRVYGYGVLRLWGGGTVVGGYGCGGLRLWGFTVVGVYGCGGLRLWGFTVMGFYGCGGLRLWGYGCGRAGTYKANRQYGLMDKGIIHYSLFIIHYSLFIIHFSFFIFHFSFFIFHFSFFSFHLPKVRRRPTFRLKLNGLSLYMVSTLLPLSK